MWYYIGVRRISHEHLEMILEGHEMKCELSDRMLHELRVQGVCDTRKYRYLVVDGYEVRRIARDKLDTLAALNKANWELVAYMPG